MNVKFSILICSLEKRKKTFNELLNRLTPQMTTQTEIVHLVDNGELTIGGKRNKLVRRSQGEYIAFVDDDDLVSFDYVPKILQAIKKKPDCCGIEGNATFKGKHASLFCHSIQYNEWFNRDGIFYRPPNHLNPILRKIASKIEFPYQNKVEDRFYSKNIYPFLKSEVYIKDPIYFYLCRKGGGLRNKGPYTKNNMIFEGDFNMEAQLCVTDLKNSAAGITINDSVFGFEGLRSRYMFVEGELFKDISIKHLTSKYINDGVPFCLRIDRKGKDMNIYINNDLMVSIKCETKNVNIGFREMRSKMRVLKVDNI